MGSTHLVYFFNIVRWRNWLDAVKVMYVLVTHNNIKPKLTGRVAGSNPVLTTDLEGNSLIPPMNDSLSPYSPLSVHLM